MQNSARIPNIPNTLIKNFFIAGVNQKTLSQKILEKQAYNIQPEVLFTMYTKQDIVNNYLQFVFPEKVAVEFIPIDPKFYTFVTTDSDGFNSFFHVLVFYEEINEAEINSSDFDIVSEILRKQHLTKKLSRKPSISPNDEKRDSSHGGEKDELFFNIKKKMCTRKMTTKCLNALQLCHVNQKTQVLHKIEETEQSEVSPPKGVSTLDRQMKLMSQQKQHEMAKKQKMENVMRGIQTNSTVQGAQGQFSQGLKSLNHSSIQVRVDHKVQESYNKSWFKTNTQRENVGGFKHDQIIGNLLYPQKKASNATNDNRDRSNAYRKSTVDLIIETEGSAADGGEFDRISTKNLDTSVNFSKATKFVLKNHQKDDYYGMVSSMKKLPRFGQTSIGNHEEPIIGAAAFNIDADFERDFAEPIELNRQTSRFPGYQDNIIDDNDEQLQQLYEKKRYVPVALVLETETEYHDTFRQILLGLFDLIRIPENVRGFGSVENRKLAFAELIAHLAFLKTIPAPTFNTVYHIHMLNSFFTVKENSFDQLPHKSQCPIKVLFDVLDPGNENLAGYADGPMVLIYASNSMTNGFDFFDGLSPEMAVCDIDACYCNNIELPCIPDEQMYIRILNMLKNSRINQYDKAYPDSQVPDTDDFVLQVRETFFGLLKPYLQKVEEFINQTIDPKDAFFQKYFNIKEYLSYFEDRGEIYKSFAEALVQSSQFQHFCDDFFQDELNNFQMLQYIFRSRGEISPDKELGLGRQRSNIFENFNFEDFQQTKVEKGISQWPDTEPVTFHFRMPQDNQRIMLFEKLLYFIEESMQKKEKNITRKTNEHILNNKDNLLYDKLINDIRQLYPIKLKGTYKKLQQQEQKIMQQNMKRFQAINNLYANMSTVESTQQRPSPVNKVKNLKHPPFTKQSSESLQIQVFDDNQANSNTNKGVNRQSLIDAQRIKMQFNQSNIGQTPNKKETPTTLLDYSYANIKMQLFNPNQVMGMSGRLPAELMGSQVLGDGEYNQSILLQMNSLHNSLFEQEQLRLQNCNRRISRLVYGQLGLISFLNHLFGLLSEKQMKQVNYYFAIRQQFKKLEKVERIQSQYKKDRMKNTLIVEQEEEQTPSRKESQKEQISNLHIDKSPSNSQTHTPLTQNLRPRIYSNSKQNLAILSNYSNQTFKSEKEWFAIDQWDSSGSSIRRTYQYILVKTKLFEAFECPEDGYSKIWKELLKFPVNKMIFFPKTKFMNIWEKLTWSQKQEVFMKLGKKQNKPCIQMISKDYLRISNLSTKNTESSSIVGYSSSSFNENLFYGACIEKTYVQRRQEQKERDSAGNCGKPSMVISHSNFSSSKPSSSSSLFKMDSCKSSSKEEKKQILEMRNQQQINSYIKQKLTQKITGNDSLKKIKSEMESKSSSRNKNLHPLSMMKSHTVDDYNHVVKYSQTPENLTPRLKNEDHSKTQLDGSGGGNSSSSQSKTFAMGSNSKKNNNDSISITPDYDLRNNAKKKKETKVRRMKEPERWAVKLIARIIEFWKKYSKFVNRKGYFDNDKLPMIQQDMKRFFDYFEEIKNLIPDFQENEILKQVFFLNLFNFLVLYQLAVLMICSPEAISQLKNYNMWQSFLMSSSIKLGGHKINAYTIMHSILRYAFKQPNISEFLLSTPAIEFQCNSFQVRDPSKLLSFGFFLPLTGMPHLRIFTEKEFDNQLRQVTQEYMVRKLQMKEDYSLIIQPRFMKWYKKDYCDSTKVIDRVKFIHKDVFLQKGKFPTSKLIDKLSENEKSPERTEDAIIDYKGFSWEFRPLKMQHFFPDPHGPHHLSDDFEMLLNFLCFLNQLINIAVSIVLFLELRDHHPLYTFGYLGTGLSGAAFSLFAFKIASQLLVMRRNRRKWVLKILYSLQFSVFAVQLAISVWLWIDFRTLAEVIIQNQYEYLEQIDAFKQIAIFEGVSSLIQGFDAWLTVRFRKFLGGEQIRVEDTKARLWEFSQFEGAMTQVLSKIELERTNNDQGTNGKKRKL